MLLVSLIVVVLIPALRNSIKKGDMSSACSDDAATVLYVCCFLCGYDAVQRFTGCVALAFTTVAVFYAFKK